MMTTGADHLYQKAAAVTGGSQWSDFVKSQGVDDVNLVCVPARQSHRIVLIAERAHLFEEIERWIRDIWRRMRLDPVAS